MGVQVETLKPGDGTVSIAHVLCYLVWTSFSENKWVSNRSSSIPGKTFPKRGSNVTVHYVGEPLHIYLFIYLLIINVKGYTRLPFG